jgi:hypothetical protein
MRSIAVAATIMSMVVGFSSPAAEASPIGPLEVPTIYAATAPVIVNVSPSSLKPGDTFTIGGENLNQTQQVILTISPTANPAWNWWKVAFTIQSSTIITAIVPSQNLGCPVTSWYVAAFTARSAAVSKRMINVDCTLVRVPNVVGYYLQNASQVLQQANLKYTESGATGFNLIVVGQSPASGSWGSAK